MTNEEIEELDELEAAGIAAGTDMAGAAVAGALWILMALGVVAGIVAGALGH